MSGSTRNPWLAIGAAVVALAIGGAYHPAHAATTDKVACSKLPSSERGICQERTGYGKHVAEPPMSPAQSTALEHENDRYRKAMAACSREPQSYRTTCQSTAGQDPKLAALD
ncbi:MAG TPA: hypothetical protein VGI14_10440 [Casimicrobiaceae bacterium]|jgi:hypothetical protein